MSSENESLKDRLDPLAMLQDVTMTEFDAVLPSILDKAFKGGL